MAACFFLSFFVSVLRSSMKSRTRSKTIFSSNTQYYGTKKITFLGQKKVFFSTSICNCEQILMISHILCLTRIVFRTTNLFRSWNQLQNTSSLYLLYYFIKTSGLRIPISIIELIANVANAQCFLFSLRTYCIGLKIYNDNNNNNTPAVFKFSTLS